MRCSFRYLLKELRPDGQEPGLLVCDPCWEPKHPQEKIKPIVDPVALRRPAPEQSRDPEDGVAAPTLDSFLPPP